MRHFTFLAIGTDFETVIFSCQPSTHRMCRQQREITGILRLGAVCRGRPWVAEAPCVSLKWLLLSLGFRPGVQRQPGCTAWASGWGKQLRTWYPCALFPWTFSFLEWLQLLPTQLQSIFSARRLRLPGCKPVWMNEGFITCTLTHTAETETRKQMFLPFDSIMGCCTNSQLETN